jgi:hypothetical protein
MARMEHDLIARCEEGYQFRRPLTPEGSGPWSKPDQNRPCTASASAEPAELGILARPMGAGRTELAWTVLAGAQRAAGTQ